MKIYIVGIGMDGKKTLTAEAEKAIENADVIIGAKRMTEPFSGLGKQMSESWKTDDICAFLDECKCDTAAVLMSGDCGFYSGAQQLKTSLSGYDTEIISGISTPVYMCAKRYPVAGYEVRKPSRGRRKHRQECAKIRKMLLSARRERNTRGYLQTAV